MSEPPRDESTSNSTGSNTTGSYSTDYSEKQTFAEAVREGHDPSRLNLRAIVLAGVGMLLLAAGTMGVVAVVLKTSVEPKSPDVRASEQWRRSDTNPGVQPNQALERRRLAARHEAILSSYGWASREQQVARIPIGRAMELLAERELKVDWPQPEADQQPEEAPGGKENADE